MKYSTGKTIAIGKVSDHPRDDYTCSDIPQVTRLLDSDEAADSLANLQVAA